MKTKIMLFVVVLTIAFCKCSYSQDLATMITPYASISGKTSGEITVAELVGQPIVVSNDEFTVTSFVLLVVDSSGDMMERPINEGIFNKVASNAIRTVSEGTKIYLESITAKNENGLSITLEPMKFVIIK
jgi:hypothetical protein